MLGWRVLHFSISRIWLPWLSRQIGRISGCLPQFLSLIWLLWLDWQSSSKLILWFRQRRISLVIFFYRLIPFQKWNFGYFALDTLECSKCIFQCCFWIRLHGIALIGHFLIKSTWLLSWINFFRMVLLLQYIKIIFELPLYVRFFKLLDLIMCIICDCEFFLFYHFWRRSGIKILFRIFFSCCV